MHQAAALTGTYDNHVWGVSQAIAPTSTQKIGKKSSVPDISVTPAGIYKIIVWQRAW